MAQAAAPTAHDAHEEHYTSTGLSNWKLGFWTFIGSECLFFATLITTYMVYKGRAVAPPYPEDIFNILITTASTTILLFSSLAMVLALDAVTKGMKKAALWWLAAVMAMGMGFIAIEAWEYLHFIDEGLTLTSSVFGSTYYLLTGTHKAHVLVGVIWMAVLWWMIFKDKLGPKDALKVEIAGLYWHFVDVIWIVIFTLVYLLQ